MGGTPTRRGQRTICSEKLCEGGVESDENNRAGSQAKPREEQVDRFQRKQLA